MVDWAHGYDVSTRYTYGFGREMAPAWLDLCARVAGCAPARAPGERRRYLELGCGQGMGLCLLAAANPSTDFLGIDFHPDHIAHAQGVATAAGLSNARFAQADFLDLAEVWPADFGTFDHVVMHGITSWIAPAVRAALVACLAHATHDGSLVYNGYNSQPGWLGTVPFQHITRRLKVTSGKPAREVLDVSIGLFDRLAAGGATTFKILPGLKARVDSVRTKDIAYLSAEYLAETWQPLWHSELAEAFAGAGLSYVGPATAAEALLPDMLPPPLRDAVVEQRDGGLRQDIQDFVINQSFRRDIFVRGPWAGPRRAFAEAVDTKVHLVAPPSGNTIEVVAAFGEITLRAPAFAAIVAALAAGPLTVGALAALPAMRDQGLGNTVQIVLLLLHAGVLAVAAPDPADAGAAHRLNAVVARGAARGMTYDHIAAAATGSAIPVSANDLLLLDAWFEARGEADDGTLAAALSARLAALGRSDGNAKALAGSFLDRSVPRWQGLGALAPAGG